MMFARLPRPCLLVIAALVCCEAAAHPDSGSTAVPRVKPAAYYAPSAMPDRVVLTWTDDPKTTQTVTWRTSREVPRGLAEIAPAGDGPRFPERARRVSATAKDFESDLSECRVHTARLTGLEPGTRYAYRVGDGTNWTEWYQFLTEPEGEGPFTFIYFGDAQNNVRSMWSRVVREAVLEAPRAAFTLHAGDLVNDPESDAEWGEWFEAAGWINAMFPVIATPGNHEYARGEGILGASFRYLTEHWNHTFAFPENGPEYLPGTAYYTDYQNLRVISLNSNEKRMEQTAWLEATLQATEQDWVVVTFHHPIYSTAEGRDNPMLRMAWKPVLERHGVDLVLNGHDHTYGRTDIVFPDENVGEGTRWRSGESGTVYVVSVSGPKMYDLGGSADIDFARDAESTQLYQVIRIDGDRLRYEARTARGVLYDAFELERRAGKPNRIIDRTPDTPARRDPG